jgi:hypothetical protein
MKPTVKTNFGTKRNLTSHLLFFRHLNARMHIDASSFILKSKLTSVSECHGRDEQRQLLSANFVASLKPAN